jgi:hypothetical protein
MSVLVVLSVSRCRKSVNSCVYRDPFNQASFPFRLMEGGFMIMSVISLEICCDCSVIRLILIVGTPPVFCKTWQESFYDSSNSQDTTLGKRLEFINNSIKRNFWDRFQNFCKGDYFQRNKKIYIYNVEQIKTSQNLSFHSHKILLLNLHMSINPYLQQLKVNTNVSLYFTKTTFK